MKNDIGVGVIIGLILTVLFGLPSFIQSFIQWKTKRADEKQKRRKYRVLVPLSASSQEYEEFIKMESGDYNGLYLKKVSADIKAAVKAAKTAWFNDHKEALGIGFGEKAIDFYCYPEGYDDESYNEAIDKALSISNREGYEVIAVIGHVTSSVTKACGSIYGEEKLPIILPLATATDLTNYLRTICGVPGVIRLVPNNAKQAELISRFLSNKSAYRAIVINDVSNPSYSSDLVSSFLDGFVQKPFEQESKKDNLYLVQHGQILAMVPINGEGGSSKMNTSLKKLNIDAFVVVGMTESALEALVQARALNLKPKFIVLTDGYVDGYLLPRVNRLLFDRNITSHSRSEQRSKKNSLKESKQATKYKIYMPFPLKCPMPERLSSVLSIANEERNLEMTHSQYIVDAVLIVLTILYENVVKRNYRQTKNARIIISKIMDDYKGQTISAEFKGTPEKYTLDHYGSCNNLDFHMYSVELPGDLKHLESVEWEKAKWSHDTDCPTC